MCILEGEKNEEEEKENSPLNVIGCGRGAAAPPIPGPVNLPWKSDCSPGTARFPHGIIPYSHSGSLGRKNIIRHACFRAALVSSHDGSARPCINGMSVFFFFF